MNHQSDTGMSKIRHFGATTGGSQASASDGGEEQLSSLEVAQPSHENEEPSKKIRAFGGMRRHEDEWSRTPNSTGVGAIHVKSFHSKLTEDALVYMDRQINEWLDAHPQYEVKFVNSAIGTFTGKLKEPQLIVSVWV
ncbi:MAG: hypothetical protein ACR2GY_07825 [Phycisphaerales bacterium]